MSNRGRHRNTKKHLIIQILGQSVANRIMECQEAQGNLPNLDVFLVNPTATDIQDGFVWSDTSEGFNYWYITLSLKLKKLFIFYIFYDKI